MKNVIGWLSAVSCLCLTPLAVNAGSGRGSGTLDRACSWLEAKAAEIIPKARRQMDDGTIGYVPQAGSNYDAVWLRDYYYALEARLIPSGDIVPLARVFLNAISPEGYAVDCVRYSGEPIYKPGYGSMGENAVADGPQFTVNVVFESWRQTDDSGLVAPDVLDRLIQTLSTLPRNPAEESELVWIDPARAWDRCPYGFTDSVRKQGYCFFESLLDIQASMNLATMLDAADRAADAERFRTHAATVRGQVNERFWDESVGLYRAATVQCREHDVWGSAFAVWLDAAPQERADRIARFFRDGYRGLVRYGQVRHTLPGVYWEKACARDSYQNGGYWGTPVGWFTYALERVAPAAVDTLYADLVAYYDEHGACEWFFGSTIAIPEGYVASVAQPLVGLRRILTSRTNEVVTVNGSGVLVKEGGGTFSVYGLPDGITSLEVRDGTLALLQGMMPSSAWFHADASRADTLTTVGENGVNYVTRWNDAEGGFVYAAAGTRPFVNTTAIPGRTVIDFGTFHYPTEGVQGYGGFMDWSATDTSIREVFMVVSDTDDIADLPERLAGNFLLGDSVAYDFHRGLNRSLFIAFTAEAIRNGLIEIDGTPRAFDDPLPAGFHLVHLRTAGNVRANAFARNRGLSWGGLRISEAIVYNRELTDEEARAASLYLTGKWLKAGDPAAHVFETLRVAANATLDVAGMKVKAADVTCRGTIRAALLSAATIHLTSDGANLSNFVLNGRFAAGDPGTIIVEGAALQPVKCVDLAFATVGGCDDAAALSRWRVEGEAIPNGWSAQLVLLDGNRLAVRLSTDGLRVQIR
ncbi:MAG: hypothetical protein J6334_07610 [Kiritimatiellae bacterium]|nr:hypothetical protein [Kiritimatiellia bacterium]